MQPESDVRNGLLMKDGQYGPLPSRIVLIGPSGAGKSDLAESVASTLGYNAIDTDSLIVQRTGMTIPEIFARLGERAFRTLEEDAVSTAVQGDRRVIATGGGAVLSRRNWEALRPDSVILYLSATPATLIERVRQQADRDGDLAERPLLQGDAIARMEAMIAARAPLYAQADVTIDTEGVDQRTVRSLVLDAVVGIARQQRVPVLSLDGVSGRSDLYVGHGARRALPSLVRQRWPKARRIWVISDDAVAHHWSDSVIESLTGGDLAAELLVVPTGEGSKSVARMGQLVSEMTARGVTRRDVVVALGGGVVGDLAGLVASVCLRGLALVQLPTTLLAMVDSSVGGKTGVNLQAGKNLLGTFYQPGLVLIDPDFLSTLPAEEYRSGMAEVVKHSVIQPSTPYGGHSLAAMLSGTRLDPVPSSVIEEVLRVNVAIKHSVVRVDEREDGPRMMLNFGHTAGHAIEADGYRYRHGEAVALGMLVASRIAVHLGRMRKDDVDELERTIVSAGLPTSIDAEITTIESRMRKDKKNVDGSLHWILPKTGGGVDIVTGVPVDVVRRALTETGATDQ